MLKDLPEECDRNPSTFWNSVIKNNKVFNKEMKKFVRPSDIENRAKSKVEHIRWVTSVENRPVDGEQEASMNKYLHETLVGSSCIDDKLQFRYQYYDILDAHTNPDGYVFIDIGLIKKLFKNDELVCAVAGHEIAHYIFKHWLMQERKALVRERMNQVFAGVASGFHTLTVSTAQANSSMYGGSTPQFQDQESYRNERMAEAKESTLKYYYQFGREEEVMSDIAAFRLLEWIGRDPKVLIDALYYILPEDNEYAYDPYNTHPSRSERIRVLARLKPAKFRVKK